MRKTPPHRIFFSGQIFTLGKAEKTLISLFTKAAEEALGKIPDDYRDRDPLDFSSSPSGSVQLMECYLTELLLLLLRSGDSSYTTEKRSENSRELAGSSITGLIVDYLKENVYADITLSDVCSKFYMGKSRLCKLFGEYLGEGPIEYFNKLKTAEAKKLLLSTNLKVLEISDLLGFQSSTIFCKYFKNMVGCTPKEYRNSKGVSIRIE